MMEERLSKAAILFTDSGPILAVTTRDSLEDPEVLKRLASKGIQKFLAFEVPLDKVKRRYANHFDVVCQDLHETDDLRVVDYNGWRVFALFGFDEYGQQIYHEPPPEDQLKRSGLASAESSTTNTQ